MTTVTAVVTVAAAVVVVATVEAMETDDMPFTLCPFLVT